MIVLTLDTEQAMMVAIAAEAANAILKARLHRVDPDNIISNSAILQDHKIDQIKAQMAEGQLARWGDLDEVAKGHFDALMMAWQSMDTIHDCEPIYDQIVAFVLMHRAKSMYLGKRDAFPTE